MATATAPDRVAVQAATLTKQLETLRAKASGLDYAYLETLGSDNRSAAVKLQADRTAAYAEIERLTTDLASLDSLRAKAAEAGAIAAYDRAAARRVEITREALAIRDGTGLARQAPGRPAHPRRAGR